MQNYTPFTLDNLPPGVDERQCFTAEEFYRVPEDFSLEQELVRAKGKRPIPAKTDIRQVQIFADQRLGLSWGDCLNVCHNVIKFIEWGEPSLALF
ncbi:hypothetical protein NIES593_07375 [Hydrococcus rivularis NIES-593]|uniref:Uncharacterized protein n=1 Tax=Hydrococcus rivularis NIES-593 TaxID=1921803 RepID=A0A1U7HLS1_9CYAN|nr:hypothetical protein [Hydrococcus rivularis]OKH24488.1 hypothetical protein NIES593_07375 [Hydrococcus rivularis NIES-593]